MELFETEDGTYILDTPGFSALKITEICDIKAAELAEYFPEFNAAGECRFKGCSHINEPDCAVKRLVESLSLIHIYKLTLDYMIEQLSSIKLKKLSKYILLIVRMGLFQIKYMDKVPESAAVNERDVYKRQRLRRMSVRRPITK